MMPGGSDAGLSALYREVVMDHHRSPRGAEPLVDADAVAKGHNPTCGDDVSVQVKLSPTGDVIDDAAVAVEGCAICRASGSMLAESAAGMRVDEARRLAAVFKDMMRGDEPPPEVDLGDLDALSGVQRFPVRVKCALLPWTTLLTALPEES